MRLYGHARLWKTRKGSVVHVTPAWTGDRRLTLCGRPTRTMTDEGDPTLVFPGGVCVRCRRVYEKST